MKTIGILGGMGPQATIDFENRLHLAAQGIIDQHENQGYPKMISYYFREAPIIKNNQGKAEIPLKVNQNLLKAAKELGSLSDFIVIPSNTPHLFVNEIEEAANKKILSLVDVTVNHILKNKFKKVGLLATTDFIKTNLYQSKLDIPLVTIEPDQQPALDKHVFAYMEGKVTQEGYEYAANMVDYLKKQGADAIILGCSEIPLLLLRDSNLPGIINPSELLAVEAVKFALE